MTIRKKTAGTIKVQRLPPYKKIKCPSCQTIGDFETDDNLETYCIHCGLVIDSAYPYTAGKRYMLLYDILYNKRIRELKKNGRKK